MNPADRKEHWEKIYETKNPEQVSWTQKVPETSLNYIASLDVPKEAKIIDVGGGDSKLVDYLLAEGYQDISVLDISKKALEKAKNRLGDAAQKVNWIVGDVTTFDPKTKFDVWHDRAVFHFLTDPVDIEKYLAVIEKAKVDYLTIATFSDNGPTKCSGLEITQYSAQSLIKTVEDDFEKIHCATEEHTTPFGTQQNFLFCSFKRKFGSM